MTPKTIAQKFLKRAGGMRFLKRLLLLEISEDEEEKQTLQKIVDSVN